MVKIKKFIRINEKIRVPEVRVIGSDGSQLGVLPIEKAREIANQYDLDLVEVAPQGSPPVCRIMDFNKFKYDQEKKEREAKKHQRHLRIKEIRLKPNIDDHDYQTKLKQAVGFLKRKDKVKINLFFRGRQMEHLDLGKRILDRFIVDLQNDGQVEREPVLEGRIMSFLVGPK